jgi:hypothetical protein
MTSYTFVLFISWDHIFGPRLFYEILYSIVVCNLFNKILYPCLIYCIACYTFVLFISWDHVVGPIFSLYIYIWLMLQEQNRNNSGVSTVAAAMGRHITVAVHGSRPGRSVHAMWSGHWTSGRIFKNVRWHGLCMWYVNTPLLHDVGLPRLYYVCSSNRKCETCASQVNNTGPKKVGFRSKLRSLCKQLQYTASALSNKPWYQTYLRNKYYDTHCKRAISRWVGNELDDR